MCAVVHSRGTNSESFVLLATVNGFLKSPQIRTGLQHIQNPSMRSYRGGQGLHRSMRLLSTSLSQAIKVDTLHSIFIAHAAHLLISQIPDGAKHVYRLRPRILDRRLYL